MSAQLLLSVLSGGVAGFALGLVGGGGSILATRLLLYVVGVGSPHLAIGTGATAVSVAALFNFGTHARAGHVRWSSAALFAAVGVGGALAGSQLGKAVDGHRLLVLFGALMVVVGTLMLRAPPRRAVPCYDARSSRRCAVLAFFAGTASGFFGVGGLVDWQVAAWFVVGGVWGGFAGMRLACRLGADKDRLRQLFAGLIFVVAAYVFYRGWSTLAGA